MTSILLSTVMKPFGIDSDDCTVNIQSELFHGQVTLAQGIFSMRAIYGGFGLEYIALNIKPRTTVLNYPSEKQFIRELKKGYDYIGITYVISTHKKMVKMAALVRQYAPDSKLILGGYGVSVPGADEIADLVCREEGVTFMRRLLGEDIDAPRRHPVIPETKRIMNVKINEGAIILAGLGCPNGCDFCQTSHFFDRRHIPLLPTGKDIWDVLGQINAKLDTRLVGIMEEDFLLYKQRVMELAEYTRRPHEPPTRIAGFSSIKAIKMYEPEFLAEMGIETLWIGVESKSAQDRREQTHVQSNGERGEVEISTYHKMADADIPAIIDSLHDVGINTLISMIVGLEHHTEELVKSDLEYHIALEPSLSQFLIYSPTPGTPLYDCLNKEGRLRTDLDWYENDGFQLMFEHKHIAPEQMRALQAECFRREYEELGPSALRFVDKQLRGYKRFVDSDIPAQQMRAKVYAENCMLAYPLYDIAIKYAPSDRVVGWVTGLRDEVYEHFGTPRLSDRLKGGLAKLLARRYRKKVAKNNGLQQPNLRKVTYPENSYLLSKYAPVSIGTQPSVYSKTAPVKD